MKRPRREPSFVPRTMNIRTPPTDLYLHPNSSPTAFKTLDSRRRRQVRHCLFFLSEFIFSLLFFIDLFFFFLSIFIFLIFYSSFLNFLTFFIIIVVLDFCIFSLFFFCMYMTLQPTSVRQSVLSFFFDLTSPPQMI